MSGEKTQERPDPSAVVRWLIGELERRANPANVEGMTRFGISPEGTLGVTMPEVRGLAREAKARLERDRDAMHSAAAGLWESAVHEARIMAAVLDVPALVTREQAERWALDLDSWDTCDQLCGSLLWRTSFAWQLPATWCGREETFVKRAGFVMAAQLAVKDKVADDDAFLPLLALVEREAFDERNDVKKAVNWALRQIGKRNAQLNVLAIESGERILENSGSATSVSPEQKRAARWIARDALRELRSDPVLKRLGVGRAR